MRRLIPALVLTVLLSSACRNDEPVLSLDDEVLIDVLIDLHLAESTMQRVPAFDKDSIGDLLRERVANTHGLEPGYMEMQIGILQTMPEKSIEIYDSVIVRLERIQEDISENRNDIQ